MPIDSNSQVVTSCKQVLPYLDWLAARLEVQQPLVQAAQASALPILGKRPHSEISTADAQTAAPADATAKCYNPQILDYMDNAGPQARLGHAKKDYKQARIIMQSHNNPSNSENTPSSTALAFLSRSMVLGSKEALGNLLQLAEPNQGPLTTEAKAAVCTAIDHLEFCSEAWTSNTLTEFLSIDYSKFPAALASVPMLLEKALLDKAKNKHPGAVDALEHAKPRLNELNNLCIELDNKERNKKEIQRFMATASLEDLQKCAKRGYEKAKSILRSPNTPPSEVVSKLRLAGNSLRASMLVGKKEALEGLLHLIRWSPREVGAEIHARIPNVIQRLECCSAPWTSDCLAEFLSIDFTRFPQALPTIPKLLEQALRNKANNKHPGAAEALGKAGLRLAELNGSALSK